MPALGQMSSRKFVLLMVLILLAGTWLTTAFKLPPKVVEYARPLGDALIIAALLALFVDRFVKERLIQEIVSNTWQYVTGHPVPTELSQYVHDAMEPRIIRRNLFTKYDFEINEGKKLVVQVEINYVIENYGINEEPYELWIEEEKRKNPVFELISFKEDPGGVQVEATHGNKLVVTESGGVVKAGVEGTRSVKVQPRGKKCTYAVKLKYHLDNAPLNDDDVLAFSGPTITAGVEVGTLPKSISFCVTPGDLTEKKKWTFNRVFLKEQHLHVRWS